MMNVCAIPRYFSFITLVEISSWCLNYGSMTFNLTISVLRHFFDTLVVHSERCCICYLTFCMIWIGLMAMLAVMVVVERSSGNYDMMAFVSAGTTPLNIWLSFGFLWPVRDPTRPKSLASQFIARIHGGDMSYVELGNLWGGHLHGHFSICAGTILVVMGCSGMLACYFSSSCRLFSFLFCFRYVGP